MPVAGSARVKNNGEEEKREDQQGPWGTTSQLIFLGGHI
jgi:hypothetical protein